jgi:hypothetical protein
MPKVQHMRFNNRVQLMNEGVQLMNEVAKAYADGATMAYMDIAKQMRKIADENSEFSALNAVADACESKSKAVAELFDHISKSGCS